MLAKSEGIVGFAAVCCLFIVGFPVFGQQYQSETTKDGASIELNQPVSPTASVTNNALTSEIDYFLSVRDFNYLKINKGFGFGGVNKNGINAGYGAKIGPKVYTSFFYTGNIIDDILATLTNSDRATATKYDLYKPNTNETDFGLRDEDGKPLSGTVTAKNDIAALIGLGKHFGILIGFHQKLTGDGKPLADGEDNGETYYSIDSSIAPYLQFGFRFGSETNVFSIILTGAFDIHEYRRKASVMASMPVDGGGNSTVNVASRMYGDFMRPQAGVVISFDSFKDDVSKTGFALTVEADMPMYKNTAGEISGKKMIETYSYDYDGDGTAERYAKLYEKLLINGRADFKFNTISKKEKMTFGVSAGVDGRFSFDMTTVEGGQLDANGELNDPQEIEKEGGINMTYIIRPNFGIGVTYEFMKDRFSVNVGLGTSLFTMKYTVGDQSETSIEMPNPTFGAGVSFNFTQNVKAETLLSSGIKGGSQGFVFLVTGRF